MEIAILALGCFWGPEIKFSKLDGIIKTEVGYCGGKSKTTTYKEVCSGNTNHAEVVKVVYDNKKITLYSLFKIFWEGHNPTQGMRQGNDIGTQYRSGIYTFSKEQQTLAEASREIFHGALAVKGFPAITTEIYPAPTFYYAEHDHQQYLAKVPNGYCGLGGTGVQYRSETT